jgi:hypothetical protein
MDWLTPLVDALTKMASAIGPERFIWLTIISGLFWLFVKKEKNCERCTINMTKLTTIMQRLTNVEIEEETP